MYTSGPIISLIFRDIMKQTTLDIMSQPTRKPATAPCWGVCQDLSFLDFSPVARSCLADSMSGGWTKHLRLLSFVNVSHGGAGAGFASCDFWLTSISMPKHTTPFLANILAYHLHPALALIVDCMFSSTVGPEMSLCKRRVSLFDRYRATSSHVRPARRRNCNAVIALSGKKTSDRLLRK